jgi:hypothetical protein
MQDEKRQETAEQQPHRGASRRFRPSPVGLSCLLLPLILAACGGGSTSAPPGRGGPAVQPTSFPPASYDYFREMDGGVALTPEEVRGRNTWLIWTSDNDAFWDYLARHSFGAFDLLKIIDSRRRGQRFAYYGITNEPGFRQATAPDENGLWLDTPAGTEDPCYAETYNESFPREQFRQVYGCSSGVVSLRLFPNPDFVGAAKERWDPERYYNDPAYYRDPNLIRPYRVGMACGFCHVGPHPTRPPADVENPGWENMSSTIGAQYWWTSRIFTFDQGPDSLVYQILDSQPPGTVDTSFVSTDNINNPRTMNAIFNVGPRLAVAQPERLAGGNLDIRGAEPVMKVPHILKDGADSVGIVGALSRVFINIGEFHEEWITHFNPMVGGKPTTPMEVAVAERDSPYWRATAERVDDLASFFLKAAVPNYLADAPNGRSYLTEDAATVDRGKQVFAAQCAGCHSSKFPDPPAGVTLFSPEWDRWARTPEFRAKMTELVMQPDFLDDNYLSTDRRYPITLIGTNACSALATNGLRGEIWDNFTSETYKNLPAVGTIKVQHPLTGATTDYVMPGGGRGYVRAPSLISAWATAPFFQSNALGYYNHDPSVAGRMQAFKDGIEKLLWPERRLGMGSIYRTSAESWLTLDEVYLPPAVVPILRARGLIEPGERELRIGPIPKGTPVNLLANINNELSFEPRRLRNLVAVLLRTKLALKRIRDEKLEGEQATAVLRELVPGLLAVSKCPDFVTDRGHTFGSELPDDDKRALIAWLKYL